MWTSALAGAVALAMVGSLNISTDGIGISKAAASEVVITHGHIARLKSALRLTPDQIRHWRPVEAALRNLAQHSVRRSSDDTGMFERVRSRAVVSPTSYSRSSAV